MSIVFAAFASMQGVAPMVSLDEDKNEYTLTLNGSAEARFRAPDFAQGGVPEVTVSPPRDGWVHVCMEWTLNEQAAIDHLAVPFDVLFEPDSWWAPHLSPEPGDCIAQHVFRAPAIIAAEGAKTFVLVPNLDLVGVRKDAPWFMDYDARAGTVWLGLSRSEIVGHVHYRKAPGMTLAPGTLRLGFYLTVYDDENMPRNPWGRVSSFLWKRWGRPLYQEGAPLETPLDRYVEHTYRWAFETWEDAVWQEFELDGRRVGAPAFIVNVTQSPNYPGEVDFREFLSIWNQAWFSSLRSASGLLRYARRTGNEDLERRAMLTKELALSAPAQKGIFPSVYAADMYEKVIDGETYRRTRGWDTGFWQNSTRVPWERGITGRWFHVLDASWTALLMLRWHDELDRDPRLLEYARRYADGLLEWQDDKGYFPAWLHPDTLEPGGVLDQSPETSMSVTFLLKLAELTDASEYEQAALRALDAVLEEVVPVGRWEDFETYWSCCQWGKEEYLGKRIPRNAMYKQNTLSIFWTAEACLAAYRQTGEARYLRWGRRTLDELSMAQQVWQPPFIYVPALGGFGVMNFDGEWNDARQSLFCELFLEYYKETGEPELFERGVAALKASFIMMYCPENPVVRPLWERVWDFFGKEDYGFMMENYGHGGAASPEGEGMGNFTIYDWGNGAASEARSRVRDHFGDVYIDRTRGLGFGIDSIGVTQQNGAWRLEDMAGVPRDVRVVFEDGGSRVVHLDGEAEL